MPFESIVLFSSRNVDNKFRCSINKWDNWYISDSKSKENRQNGVKIEEIDESTNEEVINCVV